MRWFYFLIIASVCVYMCLLLIHVYKIVVYVHSYIHNSSNSCLDCHALLLTLCLSAILSASCKLTIMIFLFISFLICTTDSP